jgi:hypothetical protein
MQRHAVLQTANCGERSLLLASLYYYAGDEMVIMRSRICIGMKLVQDLVQWQAVLLVALNI